ncbi:uracil-DNA glycosylase [Solimonas marina]|uniref:Type-4 uracil-DNA glycosylase n=1 Tax=Solimonas marina TaxID=2714601 RepID=A0A969W9N8_9GAMM|nr:uracil-DNA glycosylase [Solimonas marina]NKF23321.1 uracil-DNA glycosylase [Solimonas marina]
MDAARRHRYLKLMGIDAWRLRGAEPDPLEAEMPPATVAEAAPPARAAAAPRPTTPRPSAAPPRPAAVPRTAPQPATPSLVATPPVAAPRVVDVPGDWTGLRAMVSGCDACKLCATRTNTVFGIGHESAPLMVIGEGPGADEDARGEPFVGRAGQLLDEMLKAIGRSRGEADPARAVFIANVVKCRPPGNRDPQPDEVEACRPYLDRQIELVQPKLIVALGRVAAQRLLSTDQPLSRLRGQMHRYGPRDTPLLITYHPAYLLRSPREKAKSWADLKQIHRLLGAGA